MFARFLDAQFFHALLARLPPFNSDHVDPELFELFGAYVLRLPLMPSPLLIFPDFLTCKQEQGNVNQHCVLMFAELQYNYCFFFPPAPPSIKPLTKPDLFIQYAVRDPTEQNHYNFFNRYHFNYLYKLTLRCCAWYGCPSLFAQHSSMYPGMFFCSEHEYLLCSTFFHKIQEKCYPICQEVTKV